MLLICHSSKSICFGSLPVRAFRVPRATVAGRAGAPFITATMKNTPKQFLERVNKNGSIPKHCPEVGRCWEWEGSIVESTGYGQMGYENKVYKAHRLAWIIFKGEIPIGKCVLHKCDNRTCVNPNHLFLGTHKDNGQDMVKKGRSICQRGDQNHSRKISSKIVRRIRFLVSRGQAQKKVATKFGITPSNVCLIVNRKSWV